MYPAAGFYARCQDLLRNISVYRYRIRTRFPEFNGNKGRLGSVRCRIRLAAQKTVVSEKGALDVCKSE